MWQDFVCEGYAGKGHTVNFTCGGIDISISFLPENCENCEVQLSLCKFKRKVSDQ